MKRALFLVAACSVAVAPLIVPSALQAQSRQAAYKAPRNAFGQPDIQGYWTNATLTPESRPASYGDRLVMTPEEVAREEGNAARLAVSDNDPIDPNAPPPSVGGDLPASGQFSAAGGNVGGYDRGWLDPGNSVMRVGGQPRTSFLTTPNGRPPAPDVQAAAAPAAGRGGGAAAAGRGGGGGGGGAAAATAGRGGGGAGAAAALAAAGRGGGQGRGGGGGGGGGGFGAAYDNPETRSAGERCLSSFGRNAGPPMLPNGFYNNNYQIVQGRDSVAILVEMVHDVRVVRLNSEHRKDDVRPWFGDSIGWYEGDTLVVETTHLPQRLAYNGSWQNLKVTERFRRVAPDRLFYSYTIEDPTRWSQPWGGEYEFGPLGGQVFEYACHEGNYALEGILAGARAAELAATGAPEPLPLGRVAPTPGVRPPSGDEM